MTQAKECRRILASGAKCKALALHGKPFCYFHQAQRSFTQENRARGKSILVPCLEDRASIQISIMSVLDALGSSKIDPMRARTYFYGLQLAMTNLGKDRELVARDSIRDPVCPDDGEFLAPDEDEPQLQCEGFPCNELPSTTVEESACPAPGGSFENSPGQATPAPSTPVDGLEERSLGNSIINELSPIGATEPRHQNMSEPAPEQTIDISAAAESDLAHYDARPWDRQDPEPTESEAYLHRSINRTVLYLVRGLHAATPFKTPTERRKRLAQLRSEFFNDHLAPRPEPTDCPVTRRYSALRLA